MLTYKEFINIKGFGVGSVVKMTDNGCIYSTYEEAFRYFNILKYARYDGGVFNLCEPIGWKTKTFIVKGIVRHSSFEDYLCCLACVEDRTFCVIGYNGIKLNPNKSQPKIVEDYEIIQIQR